MKISWMIMKAKFKFINTAFRQNRTLLTEIIKNNNKNCCNQSSLYKNKIRNARNSKIIIKILKTIII